MITRCDWIFILISCLAGWCFSKVCLDRQSKDFPPQSNLQEQTLGLERTSLGLSRRASLPKLTIGTSHFIKRVGRASLSELPSIFESLDKGSNPLTHTLERLVIARWAALDADAAGAYFTASHPRRHVFAEILGRADSEVVPSGGYALQCYLTGLAQTNPERCASIIRGRQNERNFRDRLKYIYPEIARQNPNLAVESAKEIRDWRLRQDVKDIIARNWFEVDPTSAAKWAQTEPRVRCESRIGAWAKKDPVAAAKYVEGITDRRKRNKGALAVVGHWAAINPEEAIPWLEDNVSPSEQGLGFRRAIDEAGTTNLDAAWALLQRAPLDAFNEIDLTSLGQFWGSNDPNAVTDWVARLNSSQVLVESKFIKGFVSEWEKYDAPAASAFEQSLAAEDKK
ncbi:MAG: hypothetical protein ACI8T1_002471 [Verrucomicrobiales bacterium]|jgi:hypothetical protein